MFFYLYNHVPLISFQKSVNAVRAVRRLSSFGASLLGKSGSLLRDRKSQGSIDSPDQSIAEDSEGVNGDEQKTTSEVEGESIKTKPQANMSESKKRNEQPPFVKEKVVLKKLSDSDSLRSLANISQLREKFESMADASRALRSPKKEAIAFEARPRSNSLDWDYRPDELVEENEKTDAMLRAPQTFKQDNEITSGHRNEDGFFKSKTLERSSRLVDSNMKTLGKLSKSTESLLSNGRPSRITLEDKGNSVINAGSRSDGQVPRSPVETLRERKKLLNEGVLPTDKDLRFKTEMVNRSSLIENGIRENNEDQRKVWPLRTMITEKRNMENLNEERRDAENNVVIDKKGLLENERTEYDNGKKIKTRVPQTDFIGKRRFTSKEEEGFLEDDKSENKSMIPGRKSLSNMTRNGTGADIDSLANVNRENLLIDRSLDRGYRDNGDVNNASKQRDIESASKNNEPRCDDRCRAGDLSRNNDNGVLTCGDIVVAAKSIGTTVNKQPMLTSTVSSGDITTRQSIQAGLEDTARERKQTDFNNNYDMPHRKGWFKSSAAAKRGGFSHSFLILSLRKTP